MAWHSATNSQKCLTLLKFWQDVVCIHIRRGGVDNGQGHGRWLSTITAYPDVISMSFVPITSLLTGVRGCGFLNHAVNLYLRCKRLCRVALSFLAVSLIGAHLGFSSDA